jgi:hypothetical protein
MQRHCSLIKLEVKHVVKMGFVYFILDVVSLKSNFIQSMALTQEEKSWYEVWQ